VLLVVVVALVCLMIPLAADAQEYSAAPASWGWQYSSEVDHPYAIDDCRILDAPDESFHAGSSYWFPVEGDGLSRVYSWGCWP
jgi:hypothetical protein